MSASTVTTTNETTTVQLSAVSIQEALAEIAAPLPSRPEDLPPAPGARDDSVPHAPGRRPNLTEEQKKLALKNALRYLHPDLHPILAPEFAEELEEYGHIYAYRFRPTGYPMAGHPIELYPAQSRSAAAIMVMIQNNLDPRVAQHPHELVTYGGNGSVFNNWLQYRVAMRYLATMNDNQTLVMNSGHPQGLFPSHPGAPRVVVTNGMVIPNHSSREDYERMYALGATQYGQMTAGSYCYIGPQGIVHGTTITLLNAGRKYLDVDGLKSKVFVTAGLGGMSGAQAKAAFITGAVGVVAEIDPAALHKRHAQGWVEEVIEGDLDALVERVKQGRKDGKPASIGFLGNIVDVWERFAQEDEHLVDLGSDQTSLHNPYGGGYYPAGLTFEEAKAKMVEDPAGFKEDVQESLRRQVAAINTLTARGMRFWDYGNSFLLEASRAGADIYKPGHGAGDPSGFRYPSYVQDIMGDIFSLGFGPFRWVCTSGRPEDLELTDKIAGDVIEKLKGEAPPRVASQYNDNLLWIRAAGANKLVVGTQARILYADCEGRSAIASAFNEAVADGRLSGPVVISRDHHDVSGTDSPWRETSNITDGSEFTADMAVQNFVGDAMRGATWVSLHNGGGTGWGEAMNGGFGLVLDGSAEAGARSTAMLHWDVNNGIARRSWARNDNAQFAIQRAMDANKDLVVTMPQMADDKILEDAFSEERRAKRAKH